LVAAILHIGNIKFSPKGDGSEVRNSFLSVFCFDVLAFTVSALTG